MNSSLRSEEARTLDLGAPDGLVTHMRTLPDENLRRLAARTCVTQQAIAHAAACELILRAHA